MSARLPAKASTALDARLKSQAEAFAAARTDRLDALASAAREAEDRTAEHAISIGRAFLEAERELGGNGRAFAIWFAKQGFRTSLDVARNLMRVAATPELQRAPFDRLPPSTSALLNGSRLPPEVTAESRRRVARILETGETPSYRAVGDIIADVKREAAGKPKPRPQAAPPKARISGSPAELVPLTPRPANIRPDLSLDALRQRSPHALAELRRIVEADRDLAAEIAEWLQ